MWLSDDEQNSLLQTGGTTIRKMEDAFIRALAAVGIKANTFAELMSQQNKIFGFQQKVAIAEKRAKAAAAATFKANLGDDAEA